MKTVWKISCSPEVFDECRRRDGFPEVVCLARCINALTFLYSSVTELKGDEPHNIRDRMNFYLFNAGVLYEGISLVRRMNKPFARDRCFQENLRPILADKATREIERLHLKNVRHNAVFHFFADTFAGIVRNLPSETCAFLKASGTENQNVHFEFADRIAVRILVGDSRGKDFRAELDTVLKRIRNFNSLFVDHSTLFLVDKLCEWKFEREETTVKVD